MYNGFISVTPLAMNMTADGMLADVTAKFGIGSEQHRNHTSTEKRAATGWPPSAAGPTRIRRHASQITAYGDQMPQPGPTHFPPMTAFQTANRCAALDANSSGAVKASLTGSG